MRVRVQIPRIARLRRDLRDVHLVNLLRHLQQIDIQPRRYMPRDMAVKGPHPWIVSVKLNHNIRRRLRVDGSGKQLHVAALGIGRVDDVAVPGSIADGQDPHVVAVDVHGVDDARNAVVNDEADGAVGFEVVHVPFGLVAEVTGVGLVEKGVVVVASEAGAVHVPNEVPTGVLAESDVDLLGEDVRAAGCLREIRLRDSKRIILACWVERHVVGSAGWQCGGISTRVKDDSVDLGDADA